MRDELRLMCVLAHPDDESLGIGGTLAKYADEGVTTYIVTATRGEHGWFGDPQAYPGPERLGQIREAELRAAARVLGVRHVDVLDYIDGELDQADPAEVSTTIAWHIRRVRPDVVITFGPDGSYGHPDHIAISQFTTAAVVRAADSGDDQDQAPAHHVAKLYYMAPTKHLLATYQAVFGDLVMRIDGVQRCAAGWQDWAVTTHIRTADYWRTVWAAVTCHRTQMPNYQALERLPDEMQIGLWGLQTYYRAFSLVNGGRSVEDDLFAGMREVPAEGI